MTHVLQIERGVSAARAHEESDKSKHHAAEERKPIKDAEQAVAKATTEEREPNKDAEHTAVAKKKKHKKKTRSRPKELPRCVRQAWTRKITKTTPFKPPSTSARRLEASRALRSWRPGSA